MTRHFKEVPYLTPLQEAEGRLHPRLCDTVITSSFNHKNLNTCDEALQLDGPGERARLHCIMHGWVPWEDTRPE